MVREIMRVLILHLDGFPASGPPGAGEGETPLLRLVGVGFFDNLRIEHGHVFALVVKGDDPLVDADHIGRHAHTATLKEQCHGTRDHAGRGVPLPKG